MITSEIIERFRLQVDDASELSSDEELALANQVYYDTCDDRPWEFLRKTKTGVVSTSVPYITLATDFKSFFPNEIGESRVYIGSKPYTVVSSASRMTYDGVDGYCYLDIPNSKLYFTKQPTSALSYEYDYICVPPPLTATTAPLNTSSKFGTMIAYGMASKFNPIEQTEKSASYRNENIAEYMMMREDLAIEDAMMKL